jgi:hypothetical protein
MLKDNLISWRVFRGKSNWVVLDRTKKPKFRYVRIQEFESEKAWKPDRNANHIIATCGKRSQCPFKRLPNRPANNTTTIMQMLHDHTRLIKTKWNWPWERSSTVQRRDRLGDAPTPLLRSCNVPNSRGLIVGEWRSGHRQATANTFIFFHTSLRPSKRNGHRRIKRIWIT